MTMRFLALVLAFTACAANQTQPPSVPPTADKVAPARDDCPNGAALRSNSRGTACWPRSMTKPPADHCRPERSLATGYMIWNCSVPTPVRDAQGNPIVGEFVLNADRQPSHAPERYREMYVLRGTDKFLCKCRDRPQGVDIKVDCRECTCVETFPDEALR